ncbi:MAG: M16 family metallopeptidase [bacterium]
MRAMLLVLGRVVGRGVMVPVVAAFAIVLALPSGVRADDLPTDPALVTGQLPSGVRYIVRQHANPPGRAAVWMHVSSGSLNETDAQRGIAHYLEHMAFNGSANFPPGTVIKFFEELGLTFGRHQNAFTSFDQTTYQLALPDNKVENLDKALLFMSDVAFKLLLDPKEIDGERQIILEEKRSRLGPQQRVQEAVLKRIAPGSILGERLPIGTVETVSTVQQPDFKAYWGTYYTPGNITVTVVADMDPKVVVEAITRKFASEPPRPTPADQDPRIGAYTADGAIVVTDPELKRAEISFNRIAKPRPPATTAAIYRDEMVDFLGTWALNQRLSAKLEQGGVSFLSASADISTLFQAATWTSASVTSEPEKWGNAFRELATEVQRARLHGFTAEEISRARAEIIAEAEVAAKRDGTLPAQALLGQYNRRIADGEPIMSATQNLAVLNTFLPGITAEEVSARFVKNFDPKNVMFVAELPSSGSVPTEAELLAFGREALSVQPGKAAEVARIASLLTSKPVPGKASEVATHEGSAVTSAWLPSGARVNHRFMDIQKDSVTVTITLAAGTINEVSANRGISEAAALAWQRPATSSLSSTQLREFMIGKKVSVSGNAADDTMTITISGSPADLETGLQMAHLLLTDAKVEQAALEQWKAGQLQAIAQRKTQPQGVLAEMLPDSIFPSGDVRQRPLTAEQVNALTLAQVNNYLAGVVKTAPIEVGVVGDLAVEQAMPLIEAYIGSLPVRARITGETLGKERTLTRAPGPRVVERKLATNTPQAVVLSGFFGTDARNLADVRLLNLASRVLSVRMNKVIREEKQLVYSIGANSRPAAVWPGFGVFLATAPTQAEKVPELVRTIAGIYDEFAKNGPTDDEIAVAKKQVYNAFDEQVKDPGYWTGQLGTLTYRDRRLDDIIGLRAAYEPLTAEQVRLAFGKHDTTESRMVFTVIPEAPAPAPAPAPAATPAAGSGAKP